MILVTGATGTNGTELIKRLSAAGAKTRALVRNPDKATALRLPNVELARGDYSDRASLDTAMKGATAVFLLSPVDQRQVELEANVIDAAKAARVGRIVKFSVIHAAADSPSRLVRWHFEAESRIRASGIPFTFIRPNMFMQEILRQVDAMRGQGAFYLPLGGVRVSLVDTRDIAEVAEAALTKSGHEGKTYDLTGPAALSFDEVAEKISAVSGKKINFVPISMEQFKQAFAGMGAPQWLADIIGELYESFPCRNDAVRQGYNQATGRQARSFEQFAADNAALFR
jgi:uncharacterized protein YbjT (DUF2867 family)